jgi:tetratricopeptide (TPR) repeat protein
MRYGQANLSAERWTQAQNAFKIAIREMPDVPEPYAGLGDALLGQQQLARALDCYKLAGRVSHGDVRYLTRVADVQERLGHLGEASQTYMTVGEIFLRRNSLSEAIDNWQRAVSLEPELLGAHHRLASVYQDQGKTQAAIREHLAIARIWQARGEGEKALNLCHVALQLDPFNEDIYTAMALIKDGSDKEDGQVHTGAVMKETDTGTEKSVAFTVRRMADVLETEKLNWQLPWQRSGEKDPVAAARHLAENQLAEEIFREETDAELLSSNVSSGLSKLERDALIGQGIDFQSRGRLREAIDCYEKAIQGGLNLPAAHFMVGILYIELRRYQEAEVFLTMAAMDPAYHQPTTLALNNIAN